MYLSEYLGQIARRRNPASQTIILSLSQCSSTARSEASPANLPPSHFPVKSGKSATFAPCRRLTGGLSDVGTDGLFHRNLIRHLWSGPSRRKHGPKAAFQAPSFRYQSSAGPTAKGISRDRPRWGLRNTGREAVPAAAIHLPPVAA